MALEEPYDEDLKISEGGVRVYLDRRVADWFEGAELGFQTDAWGGGFTFHHPDMSTC